MVEHTILLTGGTGMIGFQILLQALRAGHHVRCAVRSEAKASIIRQHPLIRDMNVGPEVLNFTIVSDIVASNAYDEAIKGCTHAIHCATVVPSNLPGADPASGNELIVEPAVRGTLSMLQAAQRESTIKRVIITSSAVAVVPWKIWTGSVPSNGKVFGAYDRNPMRTEAPFEDLGHAYIAGKTAALYETEAWVAEKRPRFSVINIHPGFVIGRNELASTEAEVDSGTNKIALGPVLARRPEMLRASSCCDLLDVAEAHVQSLTADFENAEAGKCTSLPLSVFAYWDDVCEIANSEYPHAVKQGLLSLGGHQAQCRVDIDSSETEHLLGHKLRNFTLQVMSLLGQYIEVKQAATTPS